MKNQRLLTLPCKPYYVVIFLYKKIQKPFFKTKKMACLETVKLKSNGLEDGSVFDESLNEWHLMPRNGGMRVTEDKGS